MSKVRNSIVTKFIIGATLVLFMIAQHPGPLSSAEVVKATVALKHKPLKHFVAGHRIQIEAKVTDTQGVTLVRCYFRAAGQADYVFVGMKAGDKDMFTGILPSPAVETKVIEYLFLTVNGKNQVVKTQTFKTESKDTEEIPAWQSVSGDGISIAVGTELSQATQPAGFNDSITTDVVESSARFGIVAGIYSTTQVTGGGATGAVAAGGTTSAGGTTGAAATATVAGTVAASAGLSTLAIVGASVAAVAVAAGVAVSTGGGGDDGGGGSDTTKSACDQYAGNWSGIKQGTGCYYDVVSKGYVWHDPITMTVKSDCTAIYCIAGCMDGNVSGDTMSFVGYDNCGELNVTGRFTSTTSASGTYNESQGGNGTWSATKQ